MTTCCKHLEFRKKFKILLQGSFKKNSLSSGNSQAAFCRFLYDVTESCSCDWQPPTKATGKKHHGAIVVGPAVALCHITRI